MDSVLKRSFWIWFICVAFALVGCTEQANPSARIQNSRAAVIRLSSAGCADSCVGLFFNFPADLVLYEDGRLIVTAYSNTSHVNLMQERHIGQSDICAIVNDIRATGFFDFDNRRFEAVSQNFNPHGYVLPKTLEVAADQHRTLAFDSHYFLRMNEIAKSDITPYSWITVTQIVTALSVSKDYRPYQPNQTLAWIFEQKPNEFSPLGFSSEPIIASIPGVDFITKVQQRFGNQLAQGTILFTGQSAAQLFAAFDYGALNNKTYVIDGRKFNISVRALLPDEVAIEVNGDPTANGQPKIIRTTPQLNCVTE